MPANAVSCACPAPLALAALTSLASSCSAACHLLRAALPASPGRAAAEPGAAWPALLLPKPSAGFPPEPFAKLNPKTSALPAASAATGCATCGTPGRCRTSLHAFPSTTILPCVRTALACPSCMCTRATPYPYPQLLAVPPWLRLCTVAGQPAPSCAAGLLTDANHDGGEEVGQRAVTVGGVGWGAVVQHVHAVQAAALGNRWCENIGQTSIAVV